MPQRMKCFDIDFHIDHKLHILRKLAYYNRLKDWNEAAEVRRVPAESASTEKEREMDVSPGTIPKRLCCSSHPAAWSRRSVRPWRLALSGAVQAWRCSRTWSALTWGALDLSLYLSLSCAAFPFINTQARDIRTLPKPVTALATPYLSGQL